MKRTTLLLEDSIYLKLHETIKKQGSTLKDVVNNLLRMGLQQPSVSKKSKQAKLPLHKKNGPKNGIDISDRNALYEIIDKPFK